MDDLVAFLRARLDEDEKAARAAADFGGGIHGFRWKVSRSHMDDGGTYWSIAAAAEATVHVETVEVVGSGMSGGGAHTEQVAHHAVRHDPARVLREVDAKRQLVTEYAKVAHNDGAGDYEYGYGWADGLGLAVRCAAAAYSDHSDYQPEWAPTA